METNKYYSFAKKKLFNICRSITGPGTLKSLRLIKENFQDFKIRNIKSGTKVFDWKIPPEWIIKDAFVIDKFGKRIIDFKKNNLHVVNYSIKVDKKLNKKNLLKKIFSLKTQPQAIPYVTSYYNKMWGFCISDIQKKNIKKNFKDTDKFYVKVDSKLNYSGKLNYGEILLKGKSKKEILISTYICHPSMANNELSGPILSMSLINYFKKKKLNKSIRFLFLPETIGSIAYINKNYKKLKSNVIAGFVLSCVGDEREYSCMFSKNKNSFSDQALREAYSELKIKYKEYSFLERGSDERQFNSPGIELPIASIFRSKYGTYKEYHTSLDDFNLVTKKGIRDSFILTKKVIEILQNKIIPVSTVCCEPFLSKRNLYPKVNFKYVKNSNEKLLDFLQYSNGKHDLNQISKNINLSLKKTFKIYNQLKDLKLIAI